MAAKPNNSQSCNAQSCAPSSNANWACPDNNITVSTLNFSNAYGAGVHCTSGVSATLTISNNSTTIINRFSLGSPHFDNMNGRTYTSNGYRFSVPNPAPIFACCMGISISANVSAM